MAENGHSDETSENKRGGTKTNDRYRCPNCGGPPGDQYETGNDEIREFDCPNESCRCEVFSA